MQLQVKFSTKKHSWLCFKHAVEEAQKGHDVETDIDNFHDGYYMGSTYCKLCDETTGETK